MFEKTEQELFREEFELVAPNLKMIIQKKPELMNYYERELLTNILKVKFNVSRKSSSLKNRSIQKRLLSKKWPCILN